MAKIEIIEFVEDFETFVGVYIEVGKNEYVLDELPISDDSEFAGQAVDELETLLEYWKNLADSEKFEFEVTTGVNDILDALREEADCNLEQEEIDNDKALKRSQD